MNDIVPNPDTRRNYNEFFRQLLYLSMLIFVGVVIVWQLNFFVSSALGALTLYIVFRGLMFRMTERWHWRKWIAGLVLTAMCFIVISVLAYFTIQLIMKEIPSVNISHIIPMVEEAVDKLNDKAGFTVVTDGLVQKAGDLIARFVTSVINTTYNFAANIFMMLVIVYFMFTSGRKMEAHAVRYAPFRGKSLNLLRSEFKDVVYSNAVGIPLILIAQTVVSALLYWLIGLDSYLFWAFLTGVCGLVPLVGTALVWVPAAVFFAVNGELLTGIGIVAYGILIISNTDNVIRIVLMKRVNDTHPLVVIFGVVIGIPLFGFWGIIFGPLLISVFMLLVRLYYVEYGLLSTREEAEEIARTPAERDKPADKRSVHELAAVRACRRLMNARSGKKKSDSV